MAYSMADPTPVRVHTNPFGTNINAPNGFCDEIELGRRWGGAEA